VIEIHPTGASAQQKLGRVNWMADSFPERKPIVSKSGKKDFPDEN